VRLDVALTADAAAAAPPTRSAVLVVDVLRASTTMVTALANGCRAIVPVADADEAWRRAAALPAGTALVAGERKGEPLAGFDLGNSPLEFTAERVADKVIVFTTSNGTRALLAARGAPAVAVAGLVNLTAAAAWAAATGRDVTVVCAGDRGALALEDQVCAGLLIGLLADGAPDAVLSPQARAARDVGRGYAADIPRLAREAPWGRHLAAAGRAADLAVCLALDTATLVPRYLPHVDKVVAGSR
jgi:2-phosphosulfolactate phosphatase